MTNENIEKIPGYLLFSKIGKKVLRPGGKMLTEKMLADLNISHSDRVVEFAPGFGFTAKLVHTKAPKSYLGIEMNEDAVNYLSKKFQTQAYSFVVGNASNTFLENFSVDKIYGEAMLSMQTDKRKSEIIKEAVRILVNGGLYAIHELGLRCSDENIKIEIQKELASSLKVNARPLTVNEWSFLLEKEGFKILKIETNNMRLLTFRTIISDEGFLGFLKIFSKIIFQSKIRRRIQHIRKTFIKYENHLCGITIIAEKISIP